jgi:DNA repair photolyase
MEPIEIEAKTLIRILTKSPVVTRDIDLLSGLPAPRSA